MKILSASNPQWANAAHTAINLDVEFDGLGIVPFTASASDVEAHGADLFALAAAGEFGPVAAYVAPVKSPLQLKRESEQAELETVRALPLTKTLRRMTRDQVLAAVDAAFPAGPQRVLIRQLALIAWASAIERDRDDA